MRALSAWLAAISVGFGLVIGAWNLGARLGVPSSIEYGEAVTMTFGGGKYGVEQEVDSSPTMYGLMSAVLGFLGGIWVRAVIRSGSARADWGTENLYTFYAWLIGTGVLLVVAVVSHWAFESRGSGVDSRWRLLFEVAAIAGVAWSCAQWRRLRVTEWRRENAFLGPFGDRLGRNEDRPPRSS